MKNNLLKKINSQEAPTFLSKAKRRGFICPECQNGSGKKGTGLERVPNTSRWKCFKCDENTDIMGWWALHKGNKSASDFTRDDVIDCANWFGIPTDDNSGKTARPESKAYEKDKSASALYEDENDKDEEPVISPDKKRKYQDQISQAEDYLKSRGISLETAKAAGLGYKANQWVGPDDYRPAILFFTPHGITARIIDAKNDIEKTRKKGTSEIFYAEALLDGGIVFVTEGEFDALTLFQYGYDAIALGGVNNGRKLIGIIDQMQKDDQKLPKLILLLDNDDPGDIATEKLANELESIDCDQIDGRNLFYDASAAKDPNDLLLDKGEDCIKSGCYECIQTLRSEYDDSTAGLLRDFLSFIDGNFSRKRIRTGFYKLDKALGGGLQPNLYVFGAASGIGKTTFLIQIANNLSKTGNAVFYFSLEMSCWQLMSKDLSRITYKIDSNHALKTLEIFNKSKIYNDEKVSFTKQEQEVFCKAIEYYYFNIKHLYYHEGDEGKGVDGIDEFLKKKEQNIDFSKHKPVIMVDYLQLLSPNNIKADVRQNIDYAMKKLKSISIEYDAPVIVISSFNRDGMKGALSHNAFKESGTIGYSADTLFGLQLGDPSDQEDFNRKMTEAERDVELKILKNRNGPLADVDFNFNAAFNTFEEM